MANFCKYCGKVLQDGEICSCPQAQTEAAQRYQSQQPQQPPQGYQQPPQGGYQQPPQGYQQPPQGYPQQPQQPAAPSPFADGLQRVVPFLKSYTKAPVSAVQSLVSARDTIVAGTLLVIQLIACGLLLFSALKSVDDTMYGDGESKIAAVLSVGLAAVNEDLKSLKDPSFPMCLLMGILIGAIAIAVYVVAIFAAAKISGSGATVTDAIVAAGGHSFYVTVLLLLSFITFFMMFEIGAVLFTAAMLFWVVLTGPATQAIAPPNATKEGTLWLCMALGVSIAVVVCGWISAMMMVVPFD